MGDQHDTDRAEAEKLRSFPVVPRLKQSPFPSERDFGWAGHWVDGKFRAQSPDEFVEMNVLYKTQAYYYSIDPRGNRAPRFHASGLIETNVALSSGLARELAALVTVGKLEKAREIALKAALAGMKKLARRTGYMPAYMALHPDAMGTLSLHFGLWPVDPEKHCVIGRSAGGKPGKRGFRLIGDAFMAVLRHHRAIGLPGDLVRQPMKNMRSRHPDDWSAGLAMDKEVRHELSKLPDGEEMLKRADDHQRNAAHEWMERFGRAGGYQQRELKKKLTRKKEAAKRLIEKSNRRSTQRTKEDESVIAGLKEQLHQESAAVTSLQGKNEELLNHVDFLESEITNIGRILKQTPGETVRESAVRLKAGESAAQEARQENDRLKNEVDRLKEIVAFATSLLKGTLKLLSLVKRPQLSEQIQKFEELVGEQVRPDDKPELN